MSRHRIIKSEADQPKPLAYVRVYSRGRRGIGGYVTAAMVGGALVIALAAALALLQGGLPA